MFIALMANVVVEAQEERPVRCDELAESAVTLLLCGWTKLRVFSVNKRYAQRGSAWVPNWSDSATLIGVVAWNQKVCTL